MVDFNAVLEGNMDWSRDLSTPGFPANFHSYKNYFHLVDVWRHANRTKRDYTFFSSHYKTYSSIDFILVLESLCGKIVYLSIGVQALSDQTPVSVN